MCLVWCSIGATVITHQIPNPTPRIFNIAIPSGDKMDMTMEDGLAGVCALIDANVKSGNRWV